MAQPHSPAPIDPNDLNRARANWAGFTNLMKIGVIGTILVLVGMAVFLV